MTGSLYRSRASAVGACLARLAGWSLCLAAARLYRTAAVLERPAPSEEERRYARTLVTTYGKLD